MKLKLLGSLLFALALAACGGGGGGGGTNPPGGGGNNPPNGGGGNNPPTLTTSYEGLDFTASRADLLAQINAQGARSFNFFGPNQLSSAFFNFYYKDNSNTYVGEILDTPTTRADLLAQMNAQGAKGFLYWGPETVGTIYIKESDNATYTYRVLDATDTALGFQTQANAQGAEGFFYLGEDSLGNLYGKSSLGNPKYDYRVLAEPADNAARLSQANTQGQEGYKFNGAYVFSGEPVSAFRDVYAKDTSQTSKFEWKTNAATTSKDALVTQANAEGANGFVYWFSVFSGTDRKEFYFKPTSCAGVLCRGTNPL
jgi:hypothetical protein